MESELNNLIKVWSQVFVSITFCYSVFNIVPIGKPRLVTFLPIMFLFLVLPFNLSSFNFGMATSYFLTWLANFKLLLLAFGLGPLSDPSLSFAQFVATACFPIKIRKTPPNQNVNPCLKSPVNYATKFLISLALLLVNEYCKEYLNSNPYLFDLIVCLFTYLAMEIGNAVVAFVARAILRVDLEPQFGESYLCTSLQDFWANGWNTMSSDSLRSTVFKPIQITVTPLLGRAWASALGVMASFLVSGLMHEIMLYHPTRVGPVFPSGTTCFFIFQGFCVILESVVKKAFGGRFRLPRLISGPLIFGFAIVTFTWLVLPEVYRRNIDVMVTQEYVAMWNFMKRMVIDLKYQALH